MQPQQDERLETFTYDARNRVETVIAHYISATTAPILTARYDAFGQREELKLSQGASNLLYQWSYDLQGRLSAACLPQDASVSIACALGGATQTLGFAPRANDTRGLILPRFNGQFQVRSATRARLRQASMTA